MKSQLIWFLDQSVFLLTDNSDGNIIVQINQNGDLGNKILKVMGFCWGGVVVFVYFLFWFCLGFFTFFVVDSSFLDALFCVSWKSILVNNNAYFPLIPRITSHIYLVLSRTNTHVLHSSNHQVSYRLFLQSFCQTEYKNCKLRATPNSYFNAARFLAQWSSSILETSS